MTGHDERYLGKLTPAQIEAYLVAHGWVRGDLDERAGEPLWQWMELGHHDVRIPLRTHYSDYARAVVSLVRDAAIGEERSVFEVVWDLMGDRYRTALEKIADAAQRCSDCEEDTPEGIAPLATHETLFYGVHNFVCNEHADYWRESYRKARSKGCGEQPEVKRFTQPAHVTIALAALEGK